MVSVNEREFISKDNYLQAFEQRDPAAIIVRSYVEHIADARGEGCGDVFIIESEDEIAPGTYELDWTMHCQIRGRLFVLSLTQWEADRPNKAAYEIALQMMRTLRLRS